MHMKRVKGMKRVGAVLIAGAGVVALSACGSGGEGGEGSTTTLRLAFNQTEDHPEYVAAQHLGEKLEEATDGRYTIEVYANETLGTQSDVINNVSDGSVDMMWVAGPVMESFNEDFIVFNLPYVFNSVDAQAAVLADQEAVGDLFTSMEEDKKVTVLGGVHGGVRNVYATKEVNEPEDMDGLKIRVQESDSQVEMLNLMGGVASPMGQGEVYSAMQSGVLDGGENNETVYNALKHDEVAKYYSYTQHLMIPDYLLASSQTLDAMSEEDRQALLDLIPETVDESNSLFAEFVDESKAKSEEAGAEFVTDVDVDAFKERVQPLVDESINNPVREALYEAVQTANEEHPTK